MQKSTSVVHLHPPGWCAAHGLFAQMSASSLYLQRNITIHDLTDIDQWAEQRAIILVYVQVQVPTETRVWNRPAVISCSHSQPLSPTHILSLFTVISKLKAKKPHTKFVNKYKIIILVSTYWGGAVIDEFSPSERTGNIMTHMKPNSYQVIAGNYRFFCLVKFIYKKKQISWKLSICLNAHVIMVKRNIKHKKKT